MTLPEHRASRRRTDRTTVADTLAPASSDRSRQRTASDLLILGGITLILRLPAFFASAHLTFDDGVFGASAVAMREGNVPFRDVFSSQGPAFLPLVWLGDVLGLRGDTSPRVLAVLSGLALVALVYLTALEITDRSRALLAGVLAALGGSVFGVTSSLAADGPAMVFATASFLLALRYRRTPSLGRAVAIGVTIGLGIMVKALVLPVAIPVGLILLSRRRITEIVAAVGSSVLVGLTLSLSFGFADVWDQSVVYHLDAPGGSSWGDNARKLVSTFLTRDVLLVAAGVAAAWAVFSRKRAGDGSTDAEAGLPDAGLRPRTELLLWLWLAGMVLLLIGEHPMWRPHVSQLTPPVALLIARYRPSWKAAAVAMVLVIPLHLAYALDLITPEGYDRDEGEVVAALEALPAGAGAISDEPGQVWRAGRLTPPDLVDTSILRVESGRITAESLAEEAATEDVCAVVVWSSRFGRLDGLPDRLADLDYEVVARFGGDGDRVLYLREPCRP